MQMKQYVALVKRCLEEGVEVIDRTGVGTLSIFGHQSVYDLQNEGFPLLQLKKLHIKSIVHELLWFLKGDTNIKYLNDNNVHIWDAWANKHGDLGPVYGKQWRSWDVNKCKEIDQINKVIESIKTNPTSRRHVVSAWNVGELEDMALEPCHILFQFYVNQQDNTLSLQLYQRSADIFLGVPFNIASYCILLHMVASITGYQVGKFIHTYGDAHIYLNHMNAVKEMLMNDISNSIDRTSNIVQLQITKKTTIDEYKEEDFVFINYKPHATIKAPVAV